MEKFNVQSGLQSGDGPMTPSASYASAPPRQLATYAKIAPLHPRFGALSTDGPLTPVPLPYLRGFMHPLMSGGTPFLSALTRRPSVLAAGGCSTSFGTFGKSGTEESFRECARHIWRWHTSRTRTFGNVLSLSVLPRQLWHQTIK
jgi:hypothetical protein